MAALAPTDATVAYQGNPAHDGNIAGGTLRLPIKQAWAKDMGARMSYPLVVDNIVYLTVQHKSAYGSDIYALNAANGDKLWGPIDLGGTYWWSALTYDNGMVFALNSAGIMRAFNAKTGAQIWITQMPGQSSFTSPPSAYNGVVYTGGAGVGGTVYAVREKDGNVLWTAQVMNGDSSSPAVGPAGVYVSYSCPQTYAFAPLTGKLLWHYTGSCQGGGGRTPSLYKNRLYVRDRINGGLILDPATGKLAGTFTADPAPAFHGNMGFFLTGTRDPLSSQLNAVDLRSSSTVWSFTGDGRLSSPPLVVNGVVYVASSNKVLYGLDPATGETLFQAELPEGFVVPDEQNIPQGMGAGSGKLLVPVLNWLVAFEHTDSPQNAGPGGGTQGSATTGPIFFPQTGRSLGEPFKTYWEQHGGLPLFGYPITDLQNEVSKTDGKVYQVQYFERNRFEYHPEFKGTGNEVLLGLLGSELTAGRRAAGEAPFKAVPNSGASGGRYFPQSGHTIHPVFASYWDSHGGLAVFGYPISEAFNERSTDDGKMYQVQYFERNRFEYHPENADTPYVIQLGRLGVVVLQSRSGRK